MIKRNITLTLIMFFMLSTLSVCTSCDNITNNATEEIAGVINNEIENEIETGNADGESANDDESLTNDDENSSNNKCESYRYLASETLLLDSRYRDVRQAVYDGLEEHDLQGTILVGVGDDIVYAESFGKASEWDNIDNTNITRYGIASLTKSFTSAAIMQLYEEGKLDIYDSIDKYFPDYKYGKDITILELMQMRSGIIDYLNDMKRYMTVSDSKAIYEEFIENKDYKGLDEYKWSREDMLKNLYNNDLLFEPDEQYAYSNTNYYLLGCIIEQVSGMEYDEYITEKILMPCDMSNSNLKPLENDAVSYIKSEGFVSSSYETLFAAGGIRSDVFDMFSWIRNLSKGNIVSEESFEMMTDVKDVAIKDKQHYEKEQQRLKEELKDEYEEPEIAPDYEPTYYACGLMVTGPNVWHRGYIDGFANYMSVNVETDVTIIILTNSGDERATKDIGGLWNDINDAVEKIER